MSPSAVAFRCARPLAALVPVIAGLCLAGVSAPPALAQPVPSPAPAAPSGEAFAVHLYQQLGKMAGNLAFSPFSISSALELAYLGSRGDTAAALAAALGITASPTAAADAYGQLSLQLNAENHRGAKLIIANSLWTQEDYPFRPEFLARGQRDFAAELKPVDFIADSDGARSAINAWVESATQGKIANLIPAGGLSLETRLVLCNAVYFKARWQKPFAKSSTLPGNFYLSPDEPISLPLMRETGVFRMTAGDGCRLAELPYAGGSASMIILLPDTADGLTTLEYHFNADNLAAWLGKLDQSRPVALNVALPPFALTRNSDLNSTLGALGLSLVFNPSADFSGIAANGRLFISKLFHECTVAVDEEGTEAAAATAGAMAGMALLKPQGDFYVDHPFIFLIRDNATGTVLFLGRVADPRS